MVVGDAKLAIVTGSTLEFAGAVGDGKSEPDTGNQQLVGLDVGETVIGESSPSLLLLTSPQACKRGDVQLLLLPVVLVPPLAYEEVSASAKQ